jgi:hypothetical protein
MENILVDIRNEEESFKKEFENKDLVTIKDLINTIYDLRYELNERTEYYENKIEANKEYVRENYKPINHWDM